MNDDTKTLYTKAKLNKLNIPFVEDTEEDIEKIIDKIEEANLKNEAFVNAMIDNQRGA